MRRAYQGLGLSGLCTTQLTFKTPEPFTAGRAAEVTLKTSDGNDLGLPVFYIDSRTASEGIVTVTCSDRMAFMDEPFPVSQLTTADENDTADIAEVMDKIIWAVGGLSGCRNVPPWILRYPISLLENVTCGDVLEEITKSSLGVWMIFSDILYFLPFGSPMRALTVEKHTALDMGDVYPVLGIISEGAERYERGNINNDYYVVTASSELITDSGAADELWGRAEGYEHQSFNCRRCLLDTVPYQGDVITFSGGGSYKINNIVCDINKGGIFATIGCEGPSINEIGCRGKLTRDVAKRVTYNNKHGCMRITANEGVVLEDGDDIINGDE